VRCESILLKTDWVLVVMDQFTRRIIGFGVHTGDVDGVALCRMINTAISTKDVPKYLSSDMQYYNQYRGHQSLDGDAPDEVSGDHQPLHTKLGNYSWVSNCNGLFQTPIAA